jgi:hypothetical protein
MTKFMITTAIAVLMGTVSLHAQDINALKAEGKQVIMQLGGSLKKELKAAVKSQGAPHALQVCNERAPEITEQVNMDSGWTIARSSHKLRNPGNQPDAYTAAAIEEFLARQENGEPAKAMVKAEIIEQDGQKVFRMVKAIPTGKQCLACHGGAEVSDAVATRLNDLYPADKARDFKVGEMRGVFTLMKVLN